MRSLLLLLPVASVALTLWWSSCLIIIFFGGSTATTTDAFVLMAPPTQQQQQQQNFVLLEGMIIRRSSGRGKSASNSARRRRRRRSFPTVASSLSSTTTTSSPNNDEEIYYEPLQDLNEELHPIHQHEETDDANNASSTSSYENPMWPIGVSQADVEILIDDYILADSTMNIRQLPDFIERQIYKTTILLTLNLFYRLVGSIHGRKLWGHTFLLSRNTNSNSNSSDEEKENNNNSNSNSNSNESQQQQQQQQQQQGNHHLPTVLLHHMKTDVDEELLEVVADQLLENQAINQPLLPDVLEKQLYVNCLKIIFRLLNMLAASFRIQLCGHVLTLNLEKSMITTGASNTAANKQQSLKEVAKTAVSSPTPIDTNLLRELAKAKIYNNKEGDDEYVYDDDDSLTTTTRTTKEGGGKDGELSSSSSTRGGNSNNNIWKRGQEEFIIQVNTVLYSLILGILDDLLANTELELMTDKIKVDIVPPPPTSSLSSSDDTKSLWLTIKKSKSSSSSKKSSKQRKRKQQHQQRRRKAKTKSRRHHNSSKSKKTTKLQRRRRRRRIPIKMMTISLASFVLGTLFGIATGGKRFLF